MDTIVKCSSSEFQMLYISSFTKRIGRNYHGSDLKDFVKMVI